MLSRSIRNVFDDFRQRLRDALDLTKLVPVDRTLVAFALKAAKDRDAIKQTDIDQLREQGLSDGEIMELIMLVGYTHLINTWSDVTAIETDLMWQK